MTNPSQDSGSVSQSAPAKKKGWAGGTLWLVLLLVLAAVGYLGYVWLTLGRVESPDELKAMRNALGALEASNRMEADYVDADGDLVADPAKDPKQLLDPEELAFSTVAGDDPEKAERVWKDFLAHLRKVTGRKVKYNADLAAVDQQRLALREGKLHVTAFNTGAVQAAVNRAGFVPLFTPADGEGKFSYEMEILVPAASAARSPADLRGKTIAFTAMSSTSGAKAPLMILKDEFGMLPGRGYRVAFTGGHGESLRELAAGRREAVCVASDLLARAVGAGELKPEQYRSIYKSQSLPPLCFGVPHRLHPDLVKKVKEAFTTFRFEGTSVGEAYKASGRVRFAPVDYKLNWAFVRQIDDSLARLLKDM